MIHNMISTSQMHHPWLHKRIIQAGAVVTLLTGIVLLLTIAQATTTTSASSRSQEKVSAHAYDIYQGRDNNQKRMPQVSPTTTSISKGNGGSATRPQKVSAAMWEEFASRPGAKARYMVMLTEQADASNEIRDWKARGEYVCATLKQTADRTQPSVKAALATLKSAGHVEYVESYIIVNGLQVVGDLTSAQVLATMPEVRGIYKFPVVVADEGAQRGTVTDMVQAVGSPFPTATPCSCPIGAPAGIQWNIERVNARRAWDMGYDGTGITIGSIDTGAYHQQEAIARRYRGHRGTATPEHNYSWFDAVLGTPAGPLMQPPERRSSRW